MVKTTITVLVALSAALAMATAVAFPDQRGVFPAAPVSELSRMDPPPDMGSSLIEASDFTLLDQDGNPVSLSNYCGHVVVLEWVNPQCPFVLRHYREGTMTDLACKYWADEVVWLSINSTKTDDVTTNKKWAEQNNLAYPVLDDHRSAVARAYGAKSTPHMFIIDKDGWIVYQGAIDDDPKGNKDDRVNYVDKALQEVVDGRVVSTPVTTPYGCTVKYGE